MNWFETRLRVRFSEIDIYRVAWHGHYVAWMEEGRTELAARFGLSAPDLETLGYLAPVVTLELKYVRPVRMGEELRVQTTITPTETATLAFSTRILDATGAVAARGKTVHVLTDMKGEIQYRLPPVVAERLDRLRAFLEVTQ